jgi:hypothetical protein
MYLRKGQQDLSIVVSHNYLSHVSETPSASLDEAHQAMP